MDAFELFALIFVGPIFHEYVSERSNICNFIFAVAQVLFVTCSLSLSSVAFFKTGEFFRSLKVSNQCSEAYLAIFALLTAVTKA